MTKNELIKAKEEIYTIKKINDIKRNAHFIDFGSEVSCYNLTSKQVIKFFDMNIREYNWVCDCYSFVNNNIPS